MLHYMVTWHVDILIITNCYGIMNLVLRKFTFIENQTFLQKLHTYYKNLEPCGIYMYIVMIIHNYQKQFEYVYMSKYLKHTYNKL